MMFQLQVLRSFQQKENGKGDEEALEQQLKESGVLTDSPLDKGVEYILDNPELLDRPASEIIELEENR